MAHIMVRTICLALFTFADYTPSTLHLPLHPLTRTFHAPRIPFYYGIKTIFLLYLSLPQTRGASYIYEQHLQPFFHTHEGQIDAAIHGKSGALNISVYNAPFPADSRIIETTQELPSEFPYNEDYSSGNPLGIGTCAPVAL